MTDANKKSNIKLPSFLEFSKIDPSVKSKVIAERAINHEKKINEQVLLERMSESLSKISGRDLKTEFKDTFFNPIAKPTIEQQPQQIVEDVSVIPPLPELPVKDIVTPDVIKLSIAKPSKIQQVADTIPPSLQKELDIIKKSIADFHRFAQRHSQLGGGGAGSVDELTFHTVQVTQPTYNATRKDYFIGVNYPGPVTINLPFQNLKPGRQILIKDQSGFAASNFITIATLDGSTIDGISTFQIVNSYESISLLYDRGGWNIV